jgi:hypothetical protein
VKGYTVLLTFGLLIGVGCSPEVLSTNTPGPGEPLEVAEQASLTPSPIISAIPPVLSTPSPAPVQEPSTPAALPSEKTSAATPTSYSPGATLAATLQIDAFQRSTAVADPTGGGAYSTGQVFLYPGRKHYAGDVLTAEIPLIGFRDYQPRQARVTIDGGETRLLDRKLGFNVGYLEPALVIPEFWDTTGQAGLHTVRIRTPLEDDAQLDLTFQVEIFPENQRPAQEAGLGWQTLSQDCCVLHYLRNTAAERDILVIQDDIHRNVAEVEAAFGINFERQAFTFYLVDNVWGNGAYAFEGGIVINYLDRNYGPGQKLTQLIRHEATHIAMLIEKTQPQMGPVFGEGIPVYVAGGHYNEEPLRQRAAALLALDLFVPLETLQRDFSSLQHEARYLQSAAVVAYLVEQHGWDTVMKLVKTRDDNARDSWDWLEKALVQTYGMTPSQLEVGLLEWLKGSPPESQVENLHMTIALQNLRREYQACCAPSLHFSTLGPDPRQASCLSVFVREGRSPENVTIEILLHEAQASLLEGDYERAESLIGAAEGPIRRADFSDSLASDILKIATLLLQHGYEPVIIDLRENQAHATVIRMQPVLEEVELVRSEDRWEYTPAKR